MASGTVRLANVQTCLPLVCQYCHPVSVLLVLFSQRAGVGHQWLYQGQGSQPPGSEFGIGLRIVGAQPLLNDLLVLGGVCVSDGC